MSHSFNTNIEDTDTVSQIIPNSSAFKVCSKCGESKPIEKFSKTRGNKDGLSNYCKPCASVRYKCWREENKEKRQTYMRQWHQANLEHETRYARERYRNDEEYRRKVLEWQRRYRMRPEVQQRHWQGKKAKGFQNNPTRAHTTVSRAIRRGLLPPTWSMVCDGCDEMQAAHWHHHKSYDRQHWLDVIPLCLDCHGETYRKEIT